jgi:predicted DCC family thiol-disulfide oxidoreductase YuxK
MSSSTSETKPTIIYDGECRFCIARVNNVRSLDKNDRFDYLPRQNPLSESRFPQIRGVSLEDGLLLVQPGDPKIYVAADAVYEIIKELPGLKLIAPLYHVPGIKQLVQLGYRLVAMNRRRLGQVCDNGVCKLP